MMMWVALAACCQPAFGSKLPGTDGWIEARTRNFNLFSNASPGKTRKIAVRLERFRQALGRITRGFELDSRVPTTIIVFRNDADFTPYKLDASGKPQNLAGYFLPGRFRNYVALDASAGSRPMRVVYHEYFHAVMNATLGRIPPWLNEGLADYYSTFRIREDSTTVEVGHPIEEHVLFLDRYGLIGWDEVFRTTRSSETYNEGLRQGAFYAQSWLLVHYLSSTDERAKGLGRYLSMLRDGADPDDALPVAVGTDRETLAAEVDRYMKTGSNYVWWNLADQDSRVDVEVREIGRGEVLFHLGDLLARRGQHETARHFMDGARAADWPTAPIETALGFSAMVDNRTREAEAHLRAATAAGGDSVEPYVRLAETLIQRHVLGDDDRGLRGKAPAAILEARRLLAIGLKLEPENFPALLAVARTYLFEGDTDAGVEAVERAKRLRPLDLQILELQACLLARGGQAAEAWAVVEHGITPKDPDVGRRAGECVVDGTLTAARDHLSVEDLGGAQEVLGQAMDSIRDPELKSKIAPVFRALALGGDVIFVDGAESGIGEFNELMEVVKVASPEEALEQLDAYVESCSDEQLCRLASDSAEQIRELIVKNRRRAKYNEAVRHANAGERDKALVLLRELEQDAEAPGLRRSIESLMRDLGESPQPR
jgi:tetratricopeptide (TPR) repeat protein